LRPRRRRTGKKIVVTEIPFPVAVSKYLLKNKNIDGALDILGFQTTFVARGARVPSLQQAKFLAVLLSKQKKSDYSDS